MVSVPYMHEFFRDKFAPFIIRNDVKVRKKPESFEVSLSQAVSWIIFIIYACFAFYGCCQLKVRSDKQADRQFDLAG